MPSSDTPTPESPTLKQVMEDVELGDEGGEDGSENEGGVESGGWTGSDKGLVLLRSDQAMLLWKGEYSDWPKQDTKVKSIVLKNHKS